MRKLMTTLTAVLVACLLRPAWADEAKPAESDPAEMFGQLDSNGDGRLGDEEVPEQHQRLFKRLLRTADANDDGQLTADEFAAGLSRRREGGEKPPRDEQGRRRPGAGRFSPEEMFERIDRDGDGKVVLDDVPEERRERFARLLERGDKDGDEALTLEEFTQAFPGGGPRGPNAGKGRARQGRPDPSRFFDRLDANGDGKVTLDEVPQRAREGIERLMKRADKDGDEALSRDELSAMRRRGGPPEGRPGGPPEGRPGRPKRERPEGAFRPPSGDRRGGPPAIFRALDSDGDGKLNEEEISAAASAIRELDADGDGSVTVEELFRGGRPRRNRE